MNEYYRQGAMNCPTCHAELTERKNPTPEQAWCGTWLDHPTQIWGTCDMGNVLIPSAVLTDKENAR
ncbi:hypothetical protein [Microbacterium sp. No. 7]|uniref:hypothetical protein n=1 Tax=Microbacterium sp. No. 7 TaxID=1714373 RepID=UPI0006ECEDC2|nr:hypothetical protein [Microbacterium sp. No. 7]ALJ19524.1 hypothetical protein AOA12_06220 [Microbacterium sp. No. 7]